eukprot:CAMPEP_0198330918 /NCGR_PEP_ID=MMETSP1450-20131203/17238_1 /TAXON_ID=753684 ORGANISM="Madagascaria erythrocladiodes, Strain CCMP3234" /NCGR_SAMPLE_ID=MMETSP1450 /ASSEMBLY_ACC=CAM_ASM_001115 /LENGTH=80 /DNA_ID=CAMNT_0044035251 /DNA_START=631 /DNA_END=873 /DNA_ORIENTATION=-
MATVVRRKDELRAEHVDTQSTGLDNGEKSGWRTKVALGARSMAQSNQQTCGLIAAINGLVRASGIVSSRMNSWKCERQLN